MAALSTAELPLHRTTLAKAHLSVSLVLCPIPSADLDAIMANSLSEVLLEVRQRLSRSDLDAEVFSTAPSFGVSVLYGQAVLHHVCLIPIKLRRA